MCGVVLLLLVLVLLLLQRSTTTTATARALSSDAIVPPLIAKRSVRLPNVSLRTLRTLFSRRLLPFPTHYGQPPANRPFFFFCSTPKGPSVRTSPQPICLASHATSVCTPILVHTTTDQTSSPSQHGTAASYSIASTPASQASASQYCGTAADFDTFHPPVLTYPLHVLTSLSERRHLRQRRNPEPKSGNIQVLRDAATFCRYTPAP